MTVKSFVGSLDRQQVTALAAHLGGRTVPYMKRMLLASPENFSVADAVKIIEYAKSLGVELTFEDFIHAS